MANVNIIITFVFSALVIGANLLIILALVHMRSAKKSVVVVLSNLAVCNILHGLTFFFKGLFAVWHVMDVTGCVMITVVTGTSYLTYVVGVMHAYLDLYLSLRRPAKPDTPQISTRASVTIVVLTWTSMVLVNSLAFVFPGRDWKLVNSIVSCVYSAGIFRPGFVLALCVLISAIQVGTVACHVATIRLLRQMMSSATSQHNQPQQQQQSPPSPKWLTTQRSMVHTMCGVMILFTTCYWPVVIIQLVAAFCPDCPIPQPIVFLMQALVVASYIGNGLVYLAKNRQFKAACRRLCCRCRVGNNRVEEMSVGRSFEEKGGSV